uniref:Chitin-binding type-2 domain-containing protein n=1 Tax=Anopheles minimus TaxID=112268 RepID=A0A182W881_9DIPT
TVSTSSLADTISRVGSDKCASGKRQDCADCRTVNICSYDQTVLTSYKCQDVEPEKPYCTGNGICSLESEPESACGVADDLCPLTQAGFYPDPANCTQYIYCDEKQVATHVSCLAANNAYNHSSSSCFLRKTLDDCYQVNCDLLLNRNKWFVYKPFPQLYFFCSNSGLPVMFECPRPSEVYDVKLQRCKFECRESGRFPYPEDNKKYYECVHVTPFKFVLAVKTHGQEIYPDYFEASMLDPLASSEENVLQGNEMPSSLWYDAPSSFRLSSPFIDKTLTGSCTNTTTIVCTGCRRVRVCIPGISDQSLLPENNCPPSTFCHTLGQGMGGACLTTVDPMFPECRYPAGLGENNEELGGSSFGILCTGMGVFPDPLDCRKFHYCTSVGRYARPFKCPSEYVYNSKKKSCSRNTQCRTVQCRPNGRSIFVSFPQDSKYYAYCNYKRTSNRSTLKNVIVYTCAEGSEFDALSNSCVFKCPREGFLAKPGDASKFYWCRKVRGNLFGYEQVCPGQGSIFSPKLGICLPPPAITTSDTPSTTMLMFSETSSPTSTTAEQTESTTISTNPTLAADTP